MEIIYRANDGTEFKTERECEFYENGVQWHDVCAFNRDGKWLNPENFNGNWEFINSIVFISFKTIDAVNKFKDVSKVMNCSVKGLEQVKLNNLYSWTFPRWVDYEKMYKDSMEEFDKISALYKKMKSRDSK